MFEVAAAVEDGHLGFQSPQPRRGFRVPLSVVAQLMERAATGGAPKREEPKVSYVGERHRPYRRLPEDFGEDGLPWGAWCQCAQCGLVARSTGTFDFYNHHGDLVCGKCLGNDSASVLAQVEVLIAREPEHLDPLGPGCRGGYDDTLDRPEATRETLEKEEDE